MATPQRPEEEIAIAAETVPARPLPLFGDDPAADASTLTEFPALSEGDGDRVNFPVTAIPDFDLHLLALAQVRGVGLHALRALILHYGNLEAVWDDDPAEITDVLVAARVRGGAHVADAIKIEGRHLLARGERERERLARNGRRVIGVHDLAFPRRLRGLPDQPLWLFVEGNVAALNAPPLVAVVGTRDASKQGIDTTRHLAWLVLEAGLGIVSGLAEGIDGAAHQVAARHDARQVAVLGTGIEVVFPATNAELRQRIVETGGVVITEYLPHERYGKANFVQRNRIQAALAAAVCPVEGRSQSGTAHTIRFARDYGRPVFGVRRGQPSPDNELLAKLATEGTLAFDLTNSRGRGELRAFLDRIDGERALPPPPIDKQFWVHRALDKLRELQSYYDLTVEEKRCIVDEVADVLEMDHERGELGRDA